MLLNFFIFNLFFKDNFNSNSQQELLDLIDFHKLNEKTLEECKNSAFIPPKYVTEAALALCAKLRKELDEHKALIKSLEIKVYPSIQTKLTTTTPNLNDNLYRTKYYNLYDYTTTPRKYPNY